MCQLYNFAFFDEASKREIRRAIIKGVSIPGHQIPFASREMPIGRGWGTGGLQITLALIGQGDVLKVIDEFDGVLPFTDKASPEVIERELHLSKNAFKRAVGRLLKEGKIEITEKSIRRKM